MDYSFYRGKRVFITGHTGFKGSWLGLWLKALAAEVTGYALKPATNPALFNVLDLHGKLANVYDTVLDSGRLAQAMRDFKPEIVFHLAAQPLVRLSYAEPAMTYETNVIGSLNALEAARSAGSVKAFVCITSDKCYENNNAARPFVESDPMGGWDIYSSSKGCVELLAASYRRSFLQENAPGAYALATARAGNVIGGGDWSPDRLLPDCVRAINAGLPVEIRNPEATRPWQHVLEPLSGYLLLGKLLFENGSRFAEGFNFGPDTTSVLKVAEMAAKVVEYYGRGEVVAHRRDDLHEDAMLSLDIAKAEKVLGWRPTLSGKEAIRRTVDWYKMFYAGEADMAKFTLEQINVFMWADRGS
ncbi:MAG: CDP-glucose 4,6-dehydratase [Planctomycetota bacterium]|nr:CDP-glucose 4,6-dehydratase [Planctomycetota bacterium]